MPRTGLLVVLILLGIARFASAAETVIVYDASNSMWGRIDGEPKVTIARRVLGEMIAELNVSHAYIAGGDWLEVVHHAMRNYKDESFILQFLSPKVMRDMKFFSIENDDQVVVKFVTQCKDELLGVFAGNILVTLTVKIVAVFGDRTEHAGPVALAR